MAAVPKTQLGLDPVAIRELAISFERRATELDLQLALIEGRLANCSWSGSDAVEFRCRWAQSHRRSISQATAELGRQAKAMLVQAAEQENTSAAISQPLTPAPVVGLVDLIKIGAAEDRAYLLGMLGRAARGEPIPLAALAAAKILATRSMENLTSMLGFDSADARPAGRGIPVVGTALPVLADSSETPAVTPASVSDLLKMTSATYALIGRPGTIDGGLRITTVIGQDERRRYIVSIPGTTQWSPSGAASAFTFTGNLVTLSGQRSVLSQAVIDAVTANVPPGAELMLVGHSQGGMTALNIASDRTALTDYRLSNVITYGSPVDNDRPRPGVAVLAFEQPHDIVPKLDLEGLTTKGFRNPLPANVRKIRLPELEGVSPLDVLANHDPSRYAAAVESIENSPGSAELFGITAFSGYLSGDPAKTSAIDVPLSRTE